MSGARRERRQFASRLERLQIDPHRMMSPTNETPAAAIVRLRKELKAAIAINRGLRARNRRLTDQLRKFNQRRRPES